MMHEAVSAPHRKNTLTQRSVEEGSLNIHVVQLHRTNVRGAINECYGNGRKSWRESDGSPRQVKLADRDVKPGQTFFNRVQTDAFKQRVEPIWRKVVEGEGMMEEVRQLEEEHARLAEEERLRGAEQARVATEQARLAEEQRQLEEHRRRVAEQQRVFEQSRARMSSD